MGPVARAVRLPLLLGQGERLGNRWQLKLGIRTRRATVQIQLSSLSRPLQHIIDRSKQLIGSHKGLI